MEDTHIVEFNINVKNIHLLGVFDGHSGDNVLIFTQQHFTKELLKNKNFRKGNYHLALNENFIKMDKLLLRFYGN